MSRSAAMLLLIGVFLALVHAEARAASHVAREGESLSGLARRYYDDSDKSMIIRAANGFVHPDDGSLAPGERLEIPELIYHQVTADDSWTSLADRYLASKDRARFLAAMNDSDRDKNPAPGTIIKVPYHVRHIFARDESLRKVTRLYYGKKRSTRWVRSYNLTKKKRFKGGDVLIFPLIDIELTDEERERLEKERGGSRFSPEDVDEQEKARKGVAEIKRLYARGRYVETVAFAQRLLGKGKLTIPQQIGVYNFLGSAYVALQKTDLAREAFLESLRLQPAMELSPITTSPKILTVFREARRALLEEQEAEEGAVK